MKKIYEIPLMKIASANLADCTLSVQSNKAVDTIDAKERGNFYEDMDEDSFWSTDK